MRVKALQMRRRQRRYGAEERLPSAASEPDRRHLWRPTPAPEAEVGQFTGVKRAYPMTMGRLA